MRASLLGRRDCLAGAAASVLARPARAAAGRVRVELRTAAGAIAIDVFTHRAPLSAGAFLAVLDSGLYGGGAFTRAVRPGNDHGHPVISVLQAAARTETPPVAHESTHVTGLRHLDGTVSLPRGAVGTATGSGFFVCVGDQPALDFGGRRNADGQGFAAFGRVVAGMEVVRAIWREPTTGGGADAYTAGQMLEPPVAITGARRV